VKYHGKLDVSAFRDNACMRRSRGLDYRTRMPTGFDNTRCAAFIATREELQRVLRSWRAPLSKPVTHVGPNMFTREPMTYKSTFDPRPGKEVEMPDVLPFEHVRLPADWRVGRARLTA
jgi:hypothetical protein